jgi:putative transposase
VVHKASTKLVGDCPGASFALENLKGIRMGGDKKGKRLRTYLNRWRYSGFQKMVEYKSERKTLHLNPGWTFSECPVCSGKLKHPASKISRCTNCGQDYDRDRLAALAIALRGLGLCGDPFPAGALASWQSIKDGHLYIWRAPHKPEPARTEAACAANRRVS